MSNKFDELAKGLTKSVTRRQALKKFGVGLAGMALACFGLESKTLTNGSCQPNGVSCNNNGECCSKYCLRTSSGGFCWSKSTI